MSCTGRAISGQGAGEGVGMTQGERIIDYIKQFGSITPMQAFSDLGITKLATRISELKREGVEFEQERINSTNRFGDKVQYMRYMLKK